MAEVDKPVRVVGVLAHVWRPEYLDATETDATEAGARPGVATSSGAYRRLRPEISGGQAVDVTVVPLQTGYPVSTSRDLTAGYFVGTETVDDVRSYEPPVFVSDAAVCPVAGPSYTSGGAAFCDVTGDVIVHVASSGTDGFVRLTPPAVDLRAAAVEVDYGYGVEVAAWSQLAIAYGPGTTRLYAVSPDAIAITDDHADSWLLPVQAVTITDAVGSLAWSNVVGCRLAVDRTGALLWGGRVDDVGDFYTVLVASSDGGGRWTATTDYHTPGGGDETVRFDLATHPDGWIALVTSDSVSGVRFWRLESAFDDLADLDAVEVTADLGTSALALAIEPSGVLWVWVAATPTTPLAAWYSRDGGATWVESEALWPVVAQVALAPHPGGGLVGLFQGEPPSGAGNDIDALVRLGGWSGPGQFGAGWSETAGDRDDVLYLPTCDPDGGKISGVTLVGTGAVGTNSGLGAIIAYSGAGGDIAHVQREVYTADTNAASARWAWSIDAALVTPDSTPDMTAVELRTRDAGNNELCRVRVYADAEGYRVRDEESGTWLTPKIEADLTAKTHMRLTFDEYVGSVLHRAADEPSLWVRTDFTGITTSITAGSGVRVDFGNFGTTPEVVARFYYVNARGIDAPAQAGLNSRSHAAGGRHPIPDAYDTVRGRVAWLDVRGGPAYAGEEYAIPAGHDYPHEALFPTSSPSPTAPWRSLTYGTDQSVAVDAAADDLLGNAAGVIVFAVRNANVRVVNLGGRPDGGSWETVCSVDLAEGFSDLSYDLVGHVLTPASGTTWGVRYLRANELAGCWVHLDPGDVEISRRRRIRGNTAGYWQDTGDGPRVRVFLEETDGTENPSGTCHLVWTSGVVCVHDTTPRRHWRVRVPSDEVPAEDYVQIGAAYVCGGIVPGKQWSATAEWGHAPNVATSTDSYGTDTRDRRGPMRRSLTLTWDDPGAERRFVGRDASDVDYLAVASGDAVVARDDVRGQLLGAMVGSDDGAAPVILLLGDHAAADGATVTDSTLWLVGYVDGELRVQGAGLYGPETGETLRVGGLVIVEAL